MEDVQFQYYFKDVREKIVSSGDYVKKFLDCFDSLECDFVEVLRVKHATELFPALRAVKSIESIVSEKNHQYYSYEIGFHQRDNSVWFNFFQGRNHHDPKFSARFDGKGLKLFSRNCGYSLDKFKEFVDFNNQVLFLYRNLY